MFINLQVAGLAMTLHGEEASEPMSGLSALKTLPGLPALKTALLSATIIRYRYEASLRV
jgi:hypothetical protein